MKKFHLSAMLALTGVVLFVISMLVGSSVDANGMLVEPAFFCVPLGIASFALAIVAAVFALVHEHLALKKENRERI